MFSRFEAQIRPTSRELATFLLADSAFNGAWYTEEQVPPGIQHFVLPQPTMQPYGPARLWHVPALVTATELAQWLSVTPSELDWFADIKRLSSRRREPKLAHYSYRLLGKSNGGLRILESPKTRLKEIQRRILSGIIDRIPVHPAAHGFRKGRSVRTFVEPHINRTVVVKLDLENFFLSIGGARVAALFRTVGYPETVASLLTGLVTAVTPVNVTSRHSLYGQPHLPQGAPTSPAIANLCAYRLDCRLAGLALAVGAQYTRYADDLAFSGGKDFERRAERFTLQAATVVAAEGFSVCHRKTRVMRNSARQHMAGLVVNEHPNLRRTDFDRLKATLHNCLRHGPAAQNRESHPDFRAHLEGLLAYAEQVNAAKATKLRKVFSQISWEL